MPAQAQQLLPQLRYSTHDWTVPAGQELNFAEYWADTKSPGDGNTYSVGTIGVIDTTAAARFSGASVGTVLPPGFQTTLTRQVAILQIVDATQAISWQRYFYGSTGAGPTEQFDRATNARGISVWAELNPVDTRVVISGETFDERIPASQAPAGNPLASATSSSGFLAVFDGNGQLLWSHHFFGAVPEQSCAITDVNVRIVRDAAGVPIQDVITYCGITSHGNPAANGSLTTLQEFAAPAGGGLPCSAPAGGATDNGPGQWDGLVGRLVHVHAAPVPGAQVLEFQSIVGGRDQDGLFGIAEIDADRFAVVGSTANGAAAGPGNATFPLTPGTSPTCLASAQQYCLGVVATFDAAATPAGALVLEQADDFGNVGTQQAPLHTVARDVHVLPELDAFNDGMAIVGSTDDPGALVTWGPFVGPDAVFDGPTEGFVLVASVGSTGFGPLAQTFRGGPGEDGLTGVQGWNESPYSFSIVGFTDQGAGGLDLEVGGFAVLLANPVTPGLTPLTSGQLGGAGLDIPTAMGPINATTTGLGFVTFGLGDHAGGGIAVDSNGRVNVVGTTNSLPPNGYPVASMGAVAFRPRQTAFPPSPNDAVRSVLDLLPATTGRTDGTGTAVAPPAGPLPIPGTTGGTTPFCALSPFGVRIGDPAPALQRIGIDFEGAAVAGGLNTALVIDRPTAGATFNLTALQFGFPNQPGFPPVVLPEGIEIWTTNSPTSFFVGTSASSQPLRFALTSPLPAGPVTFTAQLVCFQPAATIPGGDPFSATPCAPTIMTSGSASPALWISY